MGRPEITDPKGRACGFPSLRNLGQPDTFPQFPHGHCCEPDREHFSVIDPQISKFQRLHTLGPTSPTPHPHSPELACSSRWPARVRASRSSEIPPDPQKALEAQFSLSSFWGELGRNGEERNGSRVRGPTCRRSQNILPEEQDLGMSRFSRGPCSG